MEQSDVRRSCISGRKDEFALGWGDGWEAPSWSMEVYILKQGIEQKKHQALAGETVSVRLV